jgi:hypothetical protein
VELRDILELAREYHCRRIRVGDIEVEMAPEGFAQAPVEGPRIPSEAEIAAAATSRPAVIADDYKKLFHGRLPSFEDMK